jgi:hypothetical protein
MLYAGNVNRRRISPIIQHRVKIFSSAWLETIDIHRASEQVLVLTLRRGLFLRAFVKVRSCKGPNNGLECLGRLEIVPSVSIQCTVLRLSVVFPSALPGKCKNSAWIRSRPLLFSSFPAHCLPVLLLDAVRSQKRSCAFSITSHDPTIF